ncbi:MAG: transcription initiation factor TFIID subunit 3 [Cyphobasidiales sp. Tagirdzhanova-0007]|nr:MAG: transcription initiation factor TFIID subunit 3 [Cyphobasidiales sp. Tagirdzhanova-0007]
MASQSQSQFSAPASLSSSQPTAQKKERQTRIPEHLKTVKRSSSSSNSSSSSSSSASLAGHRKHRAASPKKNLRKLEAVIEAQSQQAQRDSATNTADSRNANTQQSSTASVAGSPVKEKLRKAHLDSDLASSERDTHGQHHLLGAGRTLEPASHQFNAATAAYSSVHPNGASGTTPANANPSRIVKANLGVPFLTTMMNPSSTAPATVSRSPSSSSGSNSHSPNLPFHSPTDKEARTRSGTLSPSEGESLGALSLSSASMQSASSSRSAVSTGSPKTPLSSTGLVLSITTTGKACLMPQLHNLGLSTATGSDICKSGSQPATRTIAPPMVRSATMETKTSQQSFKITQVDGIGRILVHEDILLPKDALKSADLVSPPLTAAVFTTPFPKPLNLDIEVQMLVDSNDPSGQKQPSYSKDGSSFPASHSLITPPHSVDLDKPHSHAPVYHEATAKLAKPAKDTVPFYPDKERFQSGWKFPLTTTAFNLGLNLSTAPPAPGARQSDLSPPLSAVHSSFPSMNSLNGSLAAAAAGAPTSTANAAKDSMKVASAEMERRQFRIQAWLDSPEMAVDSTNPASWSTLPKEWTDRENSEAPLPSTRHPSSSPSPSRSSLDLSIRPSTYATANAMERSVSACSKQRYEDYEGIQGFRVSGKSVQPLRVSRKRRLEEEEAADDEGHPEQRKQAEKHKFAALARTPKAGTLSVVGNGHGPSHHNNNNKKTAKGTAQSTPSPNKKAIVASAAKDKTGSSNRSHRKGRNGNSKKPGAVGCICDRDDDGEAMVQCDKCTAWFHLPCLELDDNELGDEWYCFRCSGGPLPGPLQRMVEQVNGRDRVLSVECSELDQSAYPSPSSPERPHVSLADAARISSPSTPKHPSVLHEPTFTQSNTPKVNHKRHFQDSSLVLAPSPRPGGVLPVTPQRNSSEFVRGHIHTHSLSRQYAPVTPRVGYTAIGAPTPSSSVTAYGSSFGAAANPAAAYLTYSPRSPSFNMYGRRPSRHARTPSAYSSSQQQFQHQYPSQWEEEYSARTNSNSNSSIRDRDDAAERARQWGLFYGQTPSTPPTSSLPAADFLPPLDADEAARQRFLEINSTPSRWSDAHRFPSISWT